MSVKSINLGRVLGRSIYEEWLLQEGNEGRPYSEFLEEIADIGVRLRVSNAVEPGGTDAVSSGAVWAFVTSGDARPAGSPMLRVLTYSLGDDLAPEGGVDITDWIDSASGVSGVWTLSPEAGQEWHIDNGNDIERSLRVDLPSSAPLGSRIDVIFRGGGSVQSCADVTVSSGGMVVVGQEPPDVVGCVSLECVFGPFGWCVRRLYASGEEEVTIVTRSAKVVYSGGNHASLAATAYEDPVAWSGYPETIAEEASKTLRTDIFRTLYGKAPIRGWTTSQSGGTVEYSDGATVSLSNDQTLTIYPLFTATDVAVNLGRTTPGEIATGAGEPDKTENVGTYTFTPGSYVQGFAGEAYSMEIYGTIYGGTAHTSRVEYSLDGGSWTKLCERSEARTTDTQTKTISLSGSGSHTISFRVFQESGSGSNGSTYSCYVSKMTIQ